MSFILLPNLKIVNSVIQQAQLAQYSFNETPDLFDSFEEDEWPWLPTDTTLATWIDASDANSYTTSAGTLTSVTDKAGTYSTIDVGGTPAVISNGLNSKPVFDFDGSGEYLQSSAPNSGFGIQVGSGNHWAIGVFLADFVNADKDSFWSFETNSSATSKRDYAVSSKSGDSNSWPGELALDSLSSNKISSTIGDSQNFSTPISIDQWVIIGIIFNKTGNQIVARVNGSDAFTTVNDYDNSLQTYQKIRLMRSRTSEDLDGRMAEFMSFKTAPGTGGVDISDFEKAEGYLAHKWGLSSQLPSGHPYKNSAP